MGAEAIGGVPKEPGVNGGIDQLASVIAAHLHEWEPAPAHVELAVFGSDDAAAIAATLDAFCAQHLGAPVARGLFHQSSIGSVTAVVLRDGRSVVIKARQPKRSRDLLAEVVRVQTYLADRGVLATRVLAGPLTLARGLAIVEAFSDAGAKADPRRPEIRRALAAGLHAIVHTCEPLVATTSLPPTLLRTAGDALWPAPHSRLFDFAATARGAEWIDALAQRARACMRSAGRRVIGHSDWRREHALFLGDTPVLAYDWDSLACDNEPALVGAAAHGFCADWSEMRRQAPTWKEAHAFIADYAQARGEGAVHGRRAAPCRCMPHLCDRLHGPMHPCGERRPAGHAGPTPAVARRRAAARGVGSSSEERPPPQWLPHR